MAAVVADDPEAVAFGTVADVARRAGTSGATVVRLATKLGFDGFVDLQGAVREEMARRLRPASERIRRPAAGDVLGTALAVEMAQRRRHPRRCRPVGVSSVRCPLAVGGRAPGWSGSAARPVGGDASSGASPASLFADRAVDAADGSRPRRRLGGAGGPPAVRRRVRPTWWWSSTSPATTGRWSTPPAVAAERGATLIALTDSALSPLASGAAVCFTASVNGAGPFDSHVGLLALANALLAGVAARLRRSATDRLDRGRGRLAGRRRPHRRLTAPNRLAAAFLHRSQHHGHDRAGLLGLPGLVGRGPGDGPLDVDVDPGAEGGGAGRGP